jgi:hypothetical protein
MVSVNELGLFRHGLLASKFDTTIGNATDYFLNNCSTVKEAIVVDQLCQEKLLPKPIKIIAHAFYL